MILIAGRRSRSESRPPSGLVCWFAPWMHAAGWCCVVDGRQPESSLFFSLHPRTLGGQPPHSRGIRRRCPSLDCDEDGWQYSGSFGPLAKWSNEYKRMTHHVRRRTWMRPVEMLDSVSAVAQPHEGQEKKQGGAVWMHDADGPFSFLCVPAPLLGVVHCDLCQNLNSLLARRRFFYPSLSC